MLLYLVIIYAVMIFRFYYNDHRFENVLYLYKDESIIPNRSGDFVLYFGGGWFALSIDKKLA
jgi:hypothetical protein